MNRKLKKLIEEKAWETLTEHGYNDSQLFEQLIQKVASNLVSEQASGGGGGGGRGEEPLSLNGQVFYFPFSQIFLDAGKVYAGALVIGYDNFTESGLDAYYRQLEEHYDRGGSDGDFIPDFTDPELAGGINLLNPPPLFAMQMAEFTPGTLGYKDAMETAVAKLMRELGSLGTPVNAMEFVGEGDLQTKRSAISQLLSQLRKRIRAKLRQAGNSGEFRFVGGIDPYGTGGRPVVKKDDLPPDFRASKGGFGGLGGPGGGRMAPPRRPGGRRVPGQGFGGGQGMPTPGFAPPTPPLG
tara:strand:+ start:479 stop:1366 length:888 start_codon:yes stop_codon:yes gene_type:complete